MNYFAYESINQAIKKEVYLTVYFYDSLVYIYRKNENVIVKDLEKEVFYPLNKFQFHSNKPIEKITIIQDTYGPVFSDIFNKRYLQAILTIQRFWKKV